MKIAAPAAPNSVSPFVEASIKSTDMNHHYVKTRHLPTKQHGATAARPWLLLSVFAIVAVLSSMGYIVQVSSTSAKGSEIRQLEKEIASLKDERVRAEFQLAQGSSVAAVEAKIQALGMVPTDRIEYVEPSSVALARK